MPIYAYKCDSCGFAKDVLQKLSDAPLSQCPSCAAPTFAKQVTAAGFQLKGSGWYATDFKGSGSAPASSGEKTPEGAESGAGAKTEAKTEAKAEGKAEGKGEAKKAEAPAVKKPDAAPATRTGT